MEIYEEIEKTESTESDEKSVLDYAKSIIGCKIQMKSIQDDIKDIKTAAKEKGVLIKEIDGAVADITRELKKNPMDRAIQEDIRVQLENDEDVMASLSTLV